MGAFQNVAPLSPSPQREMEIKGGEAIKESDILKCTLNSSSDSININYSIFAH